MAYDSEVFRRATRRLETEVARHRQEQETTRRQIHAATPRIGQIERDMQRLSIQLCKSVFDKPASKALDDKMTALRRDRAEALVASGFDAYALDDEPRCKLCGDSGWLPDGMCACLKRYCVTEQMKELSNTMQLGQQSFDRFRLEFYGVVPNARTGMSPRANMTEVLEHCKTYATRFGRIDMKNLLFTGGTGLGKTYLSACIARVVSENGHSVVYDTAVNILRRFEQEKFRDDESARDETHRYRNCDLLIVDDLGCETLNQFTMTALYELVNTRLTAGKATIISTNLSPNDLKRRYSPQIYSRLLGEYKVQPFFGEDIRLLP